MTSSQHIRHSPIYHKLAPIYDIVMKDVDYEEWTDYIDSLIQYHHPHAQSLLELACGTGTMALMLEQCDDYKITATDGSEEMIRVARDKASAGGSSIKWLVQDMCRLDLAGSFDVIYMVFDSLNYLHRQADILMVLEGVRKHMNPGGCFIFDFTTPAYSPKIETLLNGEKEVSRHFSYRRTSTYDSEKRIHTNHFLIEVHHPETGILSERYEETHRQHIWTLQEIRQIVGRSGLKIVAAYEDFDYIEATGNSDRITMIVQHA
ncbi:class I SAM-dependent methyltransferase [Balneolales bacterium ANBcel1]|nr:class I SAM-dependent methyltransferase [Balneolales bacterium ANBcel1]